MLEAEKGNFPCTYEITPAVLEQIKKRAPLSVTGYDLEKHVIVFLEVLHQGSDNLYYSLALAIGRDPKDDFDAPKEPAPQSE